MSDFLQISCKVLVTIAPSKNRTFFGKMKIALLLGSTPESPISVKEWLRDGEESILSYSGIVVLLNNIAKEKSTEVLAASMEHVIPQLTGTNESPLSEQKILLCNDDNTAVITTFCDFHAIPVSTLTNPGGGVAFWSMFIQNKLNESVANGSSNKSSFKCPW